MPSGSCILPLLVKLPLPLMKASHARVRALFSLRFVLSALALCFPALLHAGTSGISPSNATIDTRGWFEPEIVISMHRVNGEALENAVAGTDIDDKLRVKAGDRGLLARQPQLPTGAFSTSGLVADGVTPLLFRVSAGGGLSQQARYDVRIAPSTFGRWASCPDLNGRIWVLEDGICRVGSTITLSPQQPEAYIMLDAVAASEIGSNAGGMAEMKLSIRREGSWAIFPDAASLKFIVRKPPVILVHGYNAGPDSWGATAALGADRGPDFVFSVGYGNDDDNYANTYRDLDSLVGLLDHELRRQVENRGAATGWAGSGNWAWTRYDVVGHSQGGVLLRLLCSTQETSGNFYPSFPPFRHGSNQHRGRFHRLVTVGSPHFGSTLLQLGYRMLKEKLDFGGVLVELFGDEEKLLQPKFRIDQPSSGPDTPQEFNNLYTPDPSSRIHMLGATIDDGKTPGPRPGLYDTLPRIFKALQLHKGNDSNKVDDETWGKWIAPYGSDGVVDLRSQMASKNPDSPLLNASRMSISDNIAHSPPSAAFDTSNTETNDIAVAGKLLDLLNGPPSAFGPFPSAAECADLHSKMNATANAIEGIIAHIVEMQKPFYENLWVKVGFSQNAPIRMNDEPLPIPMDDSPAPAQTVNLALQTPVGESPNGPAFWLVQVYGPNGVTTDGVTFTSSGTYGENLQLDLAAGVVGEVVVSVQFPSTSGKTVIGEAGVVASRPPGVLTGIELRPNSIAMPAGPSLPLEVWGVYDSGTKTRLFTDSANTTWTDAQPTVATVDDDGSVTLLTPGETTVQATYNGGRSASCAIDVWAPPPVITSGAGASASAGQPFSYQITADGASVSFTARDLPEGLLFNSASGLISGSPTYQGLFHILVGALNADGQEGNREVALTVTGTNQAPTAIGLDNGSVPALQPAGTLVGRLATADMNPLDSFTYALVAGTGAADNSLFTVAGGELFTTATINPASKPQCTIRLRATDSGGLAVEQSMVLPVLGAPVIISAPQRALVFAGRSFVLECEASGREPLLFQWRKDGVDIPGAYGRTLEMIAGTPGTSSYTVRVENAYGTQTSAAAAVQVVPLSFGGWAAQFTTPGSSEIAPNGDVNHDGISNFLDYAFGTAPGETRRHLPEVRITPEGPVFVHRRALGIDPTGFHVLASTDMLQWAPFEVLPQDLRVTALDGLAEEVTLRLPPEARLFFKMKVDAAPPDPAALQSFQTWAWSHGLTMAAMNPLDDPDADGLCSLVEFAFNSNPRLADPAMRPFGGIVEDAGQDLLSLTHRRNKRASLVYNYEWSPDLAVWNPFTPTLSLPVPDADGDPTTELIEARRAILPGEPSGFLRLKVSDP